MNTDEIIRQIRLLDDTEANFYGPQEEIHLATIEQLLSVRLPPSYRKFLVNYGGGDGFTGLYKNDPERLDLGCIVGDNIRARDQYGLQQRYVLVEISPFGELYCLDTEIANSDGESPILMFSVTPHKKISTPQQIALSFAEYFHNEMLERLAVLKDELAGDEE